VIKKKEEDKDKKRREEEKKKTRTRTRKWFGTPMHQRWGTFWDALIRGKEVQLRLERGPDQAQRWGTGQRQPTNKPEALQSTSVAVLYQLQTTMRVRNGWLDT
jgi:hypothetical protein